MEKDQLQTEDRREYELAFLLAEERVLGTVMAMLADYEATVSHQSTVSSIPLAYPIEKRGEAYFGFCYFLAVPSTIEEIRGKLETMDGLMRFLMVTPPIQSQPKPARRSVESAEKPDSSDPVGPLSNEALEQKIEEILK